MEQRHALRIGGGAAVVGGLLIIVGNVAHPRESGQLDDAESLLDVVAHSDIWVGVHIVIMIGIALLLVAFFGLTHSITGDWGTVCARLGWAFAIIGVGLGLAFMLTEAVAMSALADEWANADTGEKDLALAAGNAIFQLSLTLAAGAALFLFGVAPVLYGLAILGSEDYPSLLGWVGVIFGTIATVASVVQLFTGVTTLTGLVLVPVGIVAVTLWIIYLGVLMFRKSAEATVAGP